MLLEGKMEKRRAVLVADVDEESRDSVARFLSSRNLTVYTASGGSEVIQKIQDLPIKVLVMDVELGGIKGNEVITILKKIDPQLRIIATSTSNSLELARKIRVEGVFFYALKPLDLEEIELAVKDALKTVRRK